MADVIYLGGALVFALVGILLLRATVDLFVNGPARVSVMNSVGHDLKAFVSGILPFRPGASGWRVKDGWHSRVSKTGATRYERRSSVSGDAVRR